MLLLSWAYGLTTALRWMWHTARQRCVAPPAHRDMDAAVLRDLGLDRSELGSVAAEACGRAARTRLRIVQETKSYDCSAVAQARSNAASNVRCLSSHPPSTLQAKDL